MSRRSLTKPKKQYLETKYSFLAISSAVFSLHFSSLLFIGIFSNTDLMDCSPDDPCYLITTQQLSRHCFHYKQQNTWLCLLNHSECFLQPCLLALAPYLKLSTSCLPSSEAEICSMADLRCLLDREKAGSRSFIIPTPRRSLVPHRTERKGVQLSHYFASAELRKYTASCNEMWSN